MTIEKQISHATAYALLEALKLCAEFIATECPQEDWHKKIFDALARAREETR